MGNSTTHESITCSNTNVSPIQRRNTHATPRAIPIQNSKLPMQKQKNSSFLSHSLPTTYQNVDLISMGSGMNQLSHLESLRTNSNATNLKHLKSSDAIVLSSNIDSLSTTSTPIFSPTNTTFSSKLKKSTSTEFKSFLQKFNGNHSSYHGNNHNNTTVKQEDVDKIRCLVEQFQQKTGVWSDRLTCTILKRNDWNLEQSLQDYQKSLSSTCLTEQSTNSSIHSMQDATLSSVNTTTTTSSTNTTPIPSSNFFSQVEDYILDQEMIVFILNAVQLQSLSCTTVSTSAESKQAYAFYQLAKTFYQHHYSQLRNNDTQITLTQAMDYTLKSISIYKDKCFDFMGECQCYHLLAIIYMASGKLEKSITCFTQCLSLLKRISFSNSLHRKTCEMLFLRNVGVIYQCAKDYEKAVYYYEKSVKCCEPQDLKLDEQRMQLAITLTCLASVCLRMKNYRASERHLKYALQAFESQLFFIYDDVTTASASTTADGQQQIQPQLQEQKQEEEETEEKGEEVHSNNHQFFSTLALLFSGIVHYHLHQDKSCIKNYHTALQRITQSKSQKLNFSLLKANIYYNMAKLFARQQNMEQCISTYSEALVAIMGQEMQMNETMSSESVYLVANIYYLMAQIFTQLYKQNNNSYHFLEAETSYKSSLDATKFLLGQKKFKLLEAKNVTSLLDACCDQLQQMYNSVFQYEKAYEIQKYRKSV